MKRLMILGFIMIMGVVLVACDNQAITAAQLNETEQTTNNVFTLEELSQYTGANGSTAYIAVNGIVYDVTQAFDNGMHQGIQLGGTDATMVFAVSPHSQALLDTLPVVGTLATSNTTIETTTAVTTEAVTTTQGTDTTTSITTTEQTTQITLPVFTLEELSQYTGANGSTAYIAVYGVIYDVTNVFVNGMHQGMQLGGTNATGVFEASPHSMELLATLTIVGSLEGYDPIVITQDTTTTTTQNNGTTTTCDDDDEDEEDEDEYEDEHEDEHEDDGYEYEDDDYEFED